MSLQSSSEGVQSHKRKSRADRLIRQKLDEEVFGRVAKNLKWLGVLHEYARCSLNDSVKDDDASTRVASRRKEFAFLLERMKSAEQCFTEIFGPILMSLYPHQFELTELFGKYIVVSYDLAKLTSTTQLVTEQLWEETLPRGTVEGDSVESGKRVIESLSSESDQGADHFFASVRHLHLGVTNFCSNVEQLKEQFKDDSEMIQLMVLLRPRIEQMEDTSSNLYSYAKEKVETSNMDKVWRNVVEEAQPVKSRLPSSLSPPTFTMPGLPSKTRAGKTRKKWKWDGQVSS